MVQTRIEERLELIDQEIVRMKKELSKIPVIKSSLSDIAKNLDLMRLQSEKQQQLLLMLMETTAKERSHMSDQTSESAARNAKERSHMSDRTKEREATTSKTAESD